MKHCKASLDVIAHKVSTRYIYIYIIQLTPCMLSIHRIFFLVKVGSEARTGEQLLYILCLRVHHGVLKKNSWREPQSTLYKYIHLFTISFIAHIYISNHVTNIYIYINTFPLTSIENSMVEGKSHTTWPTESNSRDHSRIS